MTIIASRNTSVATQQKSKQTPNKYACLTPKQLHLETLEAREKFFEKCSGAEKYAIDVLVPYCEEIIRRYKMQGVAAKSRPNGKLTVDAYFKSINLNYSTVRSDASLLLFSQREDWEPASYRGLADRDGNVIDLHKLEEYEAYGIHAFRIGVSRSAAASVD
jgi:hypothetical protein